MTAKMTLTGLYQYMSQLHDVDIFAGLTLPEGIDKDICIDTIMFECGEFETLYADGNVMASAIKRWSDKWYRTFYKWITALNIDYSPLENYDRTETGTEHRANSGGFTNESESNFTNENTLTDRQERQIETDNSTSAFNSNTMQAKDRTVQNDKIVDGNSVTNGEGNSASTDTNTHTDTDDITKNLHIHGNVGVTTSQEMLKSELDIARFNIYNQIADLFMEELTIPVYI